MKFPLSHVFVGIALLAIGAASIGQTMAIANLKETLHYYQNCTLDSNICDFEYNPTRTTYQD